IVLVVAAVVGDGACNARLLFGDDVAPDLAVRPRLFALDRAIGIDAVAGMDEEVGAAFEHRCVGAHAAAPLVDAPALARDIAGPDERHRAPVGRRGPETAGDGFAGNGRRS